MRLSLRNVIEICYAAQQLGAEQFWYTTRLVCTVTRFSSHNCCQFSMYSLPTCMHSMWICRVFASP